MAFWSTLLSEDRVLTSVGAEVVSDTLQDDGDMSMRAKAPASSGTLLLTSLWVKAFVHTLPGVIYAHHGSCRTLAEGNRYGLSIFTCQNSFFAIQVLSEFR